MAAAAVVSVSMGVMKPVLGKLTTLMGDEYKKIKGLRKDVAFLQRELGEMDALLEKMDSADELDPQAKKWRRDIIEMSYNIEDRIDDFMHTVGESDGKIGILKKAAKYLRTFKYHRRLANDFQLIKTQVVEASECRKRYMLDQSSECRKRYTLDQCISVTAPIVVDPRVSALYKESTSLVGIESQKDELVSWAMDEIKQLKFMAIVGFGGIGKTTLANVVYREVAGKFERKAFISVSQKPQMMVLFNSLLKQLGLQTYSHACSLQDPINDIRGHLQDKRYIIVIDDLWDTKSWDACIQCVFPESNPYGRVIITTRNENVARSCCHTRNENVARSCCHGCIYNMKQLSEEDSRKLFFDRIFVSEDAFPTELKKAASEILKKCGGLPLAIITMASMLACQPRILQGQWEYIHNSLDTRSTTNSEYEDMMYILDLSYKNLPRHLKACFLYLGAYPEDHKIRRVELVRRWVAEGFVSNSTGQDVWDVAESYFNELVNRSMIQPIYDEYNFVVSSCKVHDMLLDLIVRRFKEDNFLHLVYGPELVEQVQDAVIRRLTIVGKTDIKDDTEVPVNIGRNLSQIRSLTILEEPNWTTPLLEFKFLRVLFLHVNEVNMSCINQLSQLRYLNFRGYVKQPCQIQGLRLLETLESSDWTCSIIAEIADMPRLCHLVVPYFMRLSADGNIGKFKLLRTLHFKLTINPLETIISMGQLTALSDLDLSFPKGCAPLEMAACMKALSTSLEKLSNLRKLLMSVSFACSPLITWRADALSSLSPTFHNLEELNMFGFIFSKVPRWLGDLQNLRELTIVVKQMVLEDFSIIGTGAPSLLSLNLEITGILTERIVMRGSMGFACVKYFVFNCDCISYLSFEAGAMPELQELKLVFDANEWDKAAPGGLQHLPQLKKIKAERTCYNAAEWSTRYHYQNRHLCRRPNTIGKGIFAVGKAFADGFPRGRRQRAVGNEDVGKGGFADGHVSGHRQIFADGHGYRRRRSQPRVTVANSLPTAHGGGRRQTFYFFF